MISIPINPSYSFKKRNPHLYPALGVRESGEVSHIAPETHSKLSKGGRPTKRIRQSSKPLLNKLEGEFFNTWLIHEWKVVFQQAIRFKLGNGIWYKPDFIVIPIAGESQDIRWRAYEVKGPKAFRGGFENLKVAANQYPFIKWTLAWKQDGVWKEQTVYP